ncbi:Uncharacterized conserved protein YbbK, DUF523 family [Desulfocicer vacuolatum DSM 3385]|uniref:Uncharacterized conserved protein YbbK, DUF523 family n=1 Tax=Desulfocicer vacuolatum DSM 3385 TaxID=1121400 RepID=A0A1W2E436_9BACT|nr:DUF523 domain-containing protein [Desulfocicer vacuolatum]SMD04543.1 Uncharacterized conserved protein YbbK, DUF523 family [Desulfocicer vacuolatum DSM 3385]
MEKILISGCLLGMNVRYDNKNQSIESEIVIKWQRESRLVVVCPEVEGGLFVPRPPAEIVEGGGEDVLNGKAGILNKNGEDVTAAFIRGAEIALELAKRFSIRIAILKEKSPSCGSSSIYDGSFSGKRIPGQGVTAALLRKNGIKVFSEKQLAAVQEYIGLLPN